jgi:hypothetical protein
MRIIGYDSHNMRLFLAIGGVLILAVVAGAAVLLQLKNSSGSKSSLPAVFKLDRTIIVETVPATPSGTIIQVSKSGTPIDGTVISVPSRALDRAVLLSIGYNTGSFLRLREGTPSGVTFVLSSTPPVTFNGPVTIRFSFPRNPKYKALVGYSIAADGQLRPIDLIDINMTQGEATFSTFQPLTLTWVYL